MRMHIWRSSSIRERLNKSKDHPWALGAALTVLLFIGAAVGVMLGSSGLGAWEIARALLDGDTASKAYRIVAYARAPRVLGAVLAGGALAAGGAVLQTVLQNALAGPNIIGVNSGAGLGAVLVAAFFPEYAHMTPLAAFFGAFAAMLLVYGIAVGSGASRMTLILAGVAVSSMLSAAIDAVVTLKPDTAVSRSMFMIGGLSGVSLHDLASAGAVIAAGMLIVLILSADLNVLALGDEVARSLGMRVGVTRFFLLAGAALLVGGAVSFAGLLGFVGLTVPHAARFFLRSGSRALIPVSFLMGGILTLGCDIAARMLFAPFELPVGILLSFLGGPFFLWLLFRQRRGKIGA